MSPYRKTEYTVPEPYKLKRPMWLTMLIATVVVVACLVTMLVGGALCLRAMGA